MAQTFELAYELGKEMKHFKDGLKLLAVIAIVLFISCLTAEGDENAESLAGN